MTQDEALRLALEALEAITRSNQSDHQAEIAEDAIAAIKAALEAEDEPVQVSPLEFVAMVMEKEHLIGKPIVWAEWPNKEQNT
jgi:hypothetical protein